MFKICKLRAFHWCNPPILTGGVNPDFKLPLTSAIGDHTNVKDRIWQLMNLIKAKKEREKERVVDAIWLG